MCAKEKGISSSSDGRAPRNRTLTVAVPELDELTSRLINLKQSVSSKVIENCTINQDLYGVLDLLPDSFVDLLFVDPPYNLSKDFRTNNFKEMEADEYEEWVDSWLVRLRRTLKPTASVYICADWKSSSAMFRLMSRYFVVRNRITWEREKGRGAKSNWKNCAEDIWFATVTESYTFNVDKVKVKRKVIAPYRDERGRPKDWTEDADGSYRITHPSNLWTDLAVPFWSMPENTDHPTQKPEKMLAKIILASSNPGDFVFDPFLGSGTASVVAKKLGRRYCGVEIDKDYCHMAEKRLKLADCEKAIQGYSDGIFWERNTLRDRVRESTRSNARSYPLFSTRHEK